MYSKSRKTSKRKGKGVCLWGNIELLFDVAKSGVGNKKFNKLHLRMVAASKQERALVRRGFENVELSDIINRPGCTRRIGAKELERTEAELRLAFAEAANNRKETHTLEVPRWIAEGLSAGKLTVARGLALLFYLFRRLVKSKTYYNMNWVKKGQAYGRFRLQDLKEWCGIHISRASEALKWLREIGILKKNWVPYGERMKRGACYIDGHKMIENGNRFGRNRKPVFFKTETHKTNKETYKKRLEFELHEDELGRLVATSG